VITAGGTVEGPFAAAIGTPIKALAPFSGRTLLDIAIAACAVPEIDGIAVIGGAAVHEHLRGSGARVIDAADEGRENVLRALAAWPGERFVYLTSDLPFASAAGVGDLIARSVPYAVTMGLAADAAYAARYPKAAPHGVTLGAERVVNACGFVIGADAAEPLRSFAVKFFDARKSLLRMAMLLGPIPSLRFAMRTFGVADVEALAQRRLGVPVAAIRACDPGLCYDIDSLADYEYACAIAR
jgi:GTP:adenosylcobinamide-phosphate guanylyltransferase